MDELLNSFDQNNVSALAILERKCQVQKPHPIGARERRYLDSTRARAAAKAEKNPPTLVVSSLSLKSSLA